MSDAPIQFPRKLGFLFQPARYKVAHGGRGSAKSWSFARALLILAASKPLRVLCTREIQKSIKESVHRLLGDQIEALGLGGFYEVLESEIRGRNGSLFVFAGLQNHTVESIKSYEGVDVVWIEEAHKVSRKSWTILIPTIRKEGSEIWVSLNPELDTDETYVRFIAEPPPDAVVVQVNYSDNPWFPDVLDAERRHAQRTLPAEEYANIWLGKTKAAVEGAIYANEVREAIESGRICNVPHEYRLRTHVVLDLGWNDSMFAILVQRHISELRVLESVEVDHRTLDWLSAELRMRRHNWGTLFLPHDGAHGDYKTGKSAKQIMKEMGWAVQMVPNQPVEAGIKQARMALERAWIDKTKAQRLVQCLRRYRRNVSEKTNEPGAPVHDEFSHGADAWRYTALVAERMTNDTDEVRIPASRVADYAVDQTTGM